MIFGTLNQTLALIALGFVGLAILEGSFAYISGRLAAYTAEGITRRLRDYLFDHIQRLSFAYHSKTPTGDLIERVTSDVDSLRRFFSEQAIGVGRILLVFIINFTALLNLYSPLAWISVVTIPLVLGVSLWFFKMVTKRYEKYQEQEAILSTTLQENLTGVRVVKAFARQDYEMDKFEKDNIEKFQRGRRLLKMHSLFWPLSDIVLGFQMLAGFVYGANLGHQRHDHGRHVRGVHRTDHPVDLADPQPGTHHRAGLVGTGLVRPPDGDRQAGPRTALRWSRPDRQPHTRRSCLQACLVHVLGWKAGCNQEHLVPRQDPDRRWRLLGSTGSGKTSLVNLLPRFHEYTGGSILLDGAELKDYSREYLRKQIGIVEQEPFLFSRSIRENITYGVGRDVPQEEIERAAKAAAIHDVIMTFPDGYNTLVGEKGVTLSGGQKQRVTIARTLLKNPRILILDDSTSSVDIETEAEIREALNALMQARTTFIIAHRIQSVMIADLILVLDKGEVVQSGTHEELLAQEGMYRRIYDIQTRIDEELEMEMARVN